MINKLFVSFSVLALALVSAAASYRVELFDKTMLAGTELKPGEYRVEVKDNKAIFSLGRKTFEAPVKVETTPEKISSTRVRIMNGAIQEIVIAGTKTKLIFEN